MTVSELIEELRKYPGDMRIVLENPGYHDYQEVALKQTDVFYDNDGYCYYDDGNKDRKEIPAVVVH